MSWGGVSPAGGARPFANISSQFSRDLWEYTKAGALSDRELYLTNRRKCGKIPFVKLIDFTFMF